MGGTGGLGLAYAHTEVYGMTGQQGPAVEHRELSPVFCDLLLGKDPKRMDVRTCLTESLCRPTEVITQCKSTIRQ